MVNLLNPGPYLGWGLVMGPLLLKAWRDSPAHGVALLAAFYATLVSGMIATVLLFAGARRLGPRVNRALVGLSALALAAFGLWQLWLGAVARLNPLADAGRPRAEPAGGPRSARLESRAPSSSPPRSTRMSDLHDVVILGSGPAGFTAAIYAARANLKPLLLSGSQPGGQLTITTEVENYPGFPEGIQGPELMLKMREQAARFGTEIVDATVESVDFSKRAVHAARRRRRVPGEDASSSRPAPRARLLDIPSEKTFWGAGVSACATCDGFFFRGRRVMVVGGGDTALEEANYLTRFCAEVILVHRRDELRGSKIMQERTRKNPKVSFRLNAVIDEVLGTDEPRKVTGARLRDTRTGAVTEEPIDGIFVAIGHSPNTAFLRGALPLDEKGYVVVEPGTPRTAVPGVFAAGDVADPTYRQAVSAAGTGCAAAIEAERWLEAQGA